MSFYEFQLNLNRALSDEQELIVGSQMDDVSVISAPDGTGYLSCEVPHTEAASFAAAVMATAGQLHALIPSRWATGLRLDDAVTLSEAARRTGGSRTRQSLQQMATAERGPGGFPTPLVSYPRFSLYSWSEVAAFLRMIGDQVPEVDGQAVTLDRLLAARAAAHTADLPDQWWAEATRGALAA